MKAISIQAAYLAGFLSTTALGSDPDPPRSGNPVPREELGVMMRGTVLKVRNNQITVLSSISREPIRYSHGEGTAYVDAQGNPVGPPPTPGLRREGSRGDEKGIS